MVVFAGGLGMGSLLGIGLANALMAGGLAVVAAVLGRVSRRPALAHGLWLIVLAKLLTPPLWTIEVNVPETAESARASGVVVRYERIEPPPGETATWADQSAWTPAELPSPVEFTEVPSPGPSAVALDWLARHWRGLIGTAWVAGSLVWLGSAVARIGRFQRVIRLASPAPDDLRTTADAMARRVGLANAPTVWLVPGTVSPLVWALGGKARLLVPRDLWETLDDARRATLLTHELAHLRRRDHWVRWIELAATAVYWWCPVVWWARRELREAEEQCCDAWVVWAWPGAAKAYATALLDTVDFLAETRPAVPLAASGLGHVHHLKRRVTMILRGLTPRSLSIAGRATLFGLAALILPLAPGFAQDGPRKDSSGPDDRAPRLATPDDPFNVVFFRSNDDRDDADDKNDDDAKAGAKAKAKALAVAKQAKVKAEERRVRIERPTGPDGRPIGAKVSEEDRAMLDKARAELAEAQQALANAAKRLAEAQMKVHGLPGKGETNVRYEVRSDDDPGAPEGKVIIMRRQGENDGDDFFIELDRAKVEPRGNVRVFTRRLPDGPVPPMPPTPPGLPRGGMRTPFPPPGGPDPRGEQDNRIRDLEKKLDVLIGEIKELKARK